MNKFLMLVILILAVLLGMSSISQSYATAKQAQATIEANRVAQIASVGNLVALITVSLVIVAVLMAVVLISWLFLRARSQSKRHWTPGSNTHLSQFSQPQVNALLPALLSMMVYQMMQSQEQHQQQTEQFWMMDEPARELEVSTFSDNATWDF